MAKGKAKADAFASSRERSVGFKFKKAHLMLCANDLNKKFAMGVTIDQVDRYCRHHRENWKYIATALSNTGNTFDEKRCMNTCMDAANGLDSDDSRELFDLNTYTQPEDLEGEDSDTLPTPTRHATVDNTSSSTSQASKKRPRAKNSPTKKSKKTILLIPLMKLVLQ
ncbi:unnamed protein product [Miscanthus lutarioriparius]|uniref:Uncharacterized protein n=1 Tax=Miscanthus lutarioriparius TaxID=422564 RepID=A0A811QML3_9POAL|nr:unnamed protein product [Miscanthus lutarioriparius]